MERNGKQECNGFCHKKGVLNSTERSTKPWDSLSFGDNKTNKGPCLTSRDKWLQSYGLLRSEDVPPDLRELHLCVGYRPTPSSFTYCIKSIFYPTNETMNFWTHFIAFFLMGNRFYNIFTHKLQGPLSDPLYYPFWVYCFGTAIMLVGSCVAHIFNCYSRSIRETCWLCDYASIILSFLGCAITYHNYVCPYECIGVKLMNNYIQLLGFLGFVGHAVCCCSRRITSTIRYALRSLVFVILYLICATPCSYLYLVRTMPFFDLNHQDTASEKQDMRCDLDTSHFVPYFGLVTVFSFLTVFFNVAKVPEKWFPGTFDIVGHSHQWLHISIALAFYAQSYLIEEPLLRAETLRSQGKLSPEDLDITWWNTIGTMATLGLSCAATTWFMSGRHTSNTEKSK